MQAVGFEISGEEVKAGYAVLVDDEGKSYFYDIIAKEKFYIPFAIPVDLSFALYKAGKYSVAFLGD